MNIPARISVCLLAVAVLPATRAAAQCEVCPTPVVAYQPVVTPVSPTAITGWYPGKLLDTWAANRAAYRATALQAATTAYRPVATAMPAVSYRPLTTSLQTAFMPVSATTAYMPVTAYRPIVTTAYSPVVTTAYSPIATATVCCDPCSTATVSGYAPAASACCGVESTTPAYGSITPQPTLGSDAPQSSYYGSGSQPPAPPNGGGGGTGANERSLIDGKDSDAQNQGQQQQDQQQQSTGESASFEAPQLYGSDGRRLEEQQPQVQRNDTTARAERTAAVAAVYNQPVQPQLIASGPTKSPARKALPSRAERDAGWKAVSR